MESRVRRWRRGRRVIRVRRRKRRRGERYLPNSVQLLVLSSLRETQTNLVLLPD